MKNTVIWTLAFLLGFEPALMAQGSARQNADIKAFIEMSGLAKGPVTYRELYNKFSAYLPQAQKDELKGFIQVYGDLQVPKMDISKIKGAGDNEEIYKLQVVQNGQAGSIEIFNDSKQFARVNGQVLTADDMKSTQAVMEKVGLPKQAAEAFKRPAKSMDRTLKASDLAKLSKADQIKFFQQLRALMASTEAVEAWDLKAKSSAFNIESASKFEVVAKWLRGEDAFALKVGDNCIAAGYVPKVGLDGKKRLTCGTDGQAGIPEEFRKKPDGSFCDSNEFSCNYKIFGPEGGMNCVPAGKDTTRLCSQLAVADIPDIKGMDKKNFDALKEDAEAAAQEALKTCEATKASSTAPPVAARKKKAVKGSPQGLIDDQIYTCGELQKRWEVIQSWDCGREEFKKGHEKICGEQKPEVGVIADNKPTPGTDAPAAPGTGETPPKAPAPAGPPEIVSCDNLPKQYSLDSACAGGGFGRPKDDKIQCKDGSGKIQTSKEIYECFCKDKDGKDIVPFERNKCSASGAATDAAAGGKKEKSWFKKNSKWLIPLGFGLVGLLVYHWLGKKAAKQNFEYLEPVPQLPPVAPPAAPVPRGTN
ncbi:MAG: hypothetical protein ACXWC9_03860 [Pseudobdellovibrionaceae bacterium]